MIYNEICLPDEGDKHVLAAAIKADASIIVTFNLKDFPNEILSKYGIEAQHPDDFIIKLSNSDLSKLLISFKTTRNRLKNPEINAEEYLTILAKQGLKKLFSFCLKTSIRYEIENKLENLKLIALTVKNLNFLL